MKPTVLLVDDVKEYRDMLRFAVQEDFTIVGEAGDGIEAVTAYQRFSPSLILMDMVMPRMSGLEATRSILAMGGQKPAIIIVSSLREESVVLSAMEAGAVEYLFKPADPKTVREVLWTHAKLLEATSGSQNKVQHR